MPAWRNWRAPTGNLTWWCWPSRWRTGWTPRTRPAPRTVAAHRVMSSYPVSTGPAGWTCLGRPMQPETILSPTRLPRSVPPRLATPRDLTRRTDGAAGAFVAHAHRRPWNAWQRAAGDLLGEMTPAGTYVYQVGVIMVPRQAGKTTFVMDLAQGRCIQPPDYRAAYTAQTGHVTTERFQERMAELAGTPLAQVVAARRSAGTE